MSTQYKIPLVKQIEMIINSYARNIWPEAYNPHNPTPPEVLEAFNSALAHAIDYTADNKINIDDRIGEAKITQEIKSFLNKKREFHNKINKYVKPEDLKNT